MVLVAAMIESRFGLKRSAEIISFTLLLARVGSRVKKVNTQIQNGASLPNAWTPPKELLIPGVLEMLSAPVLLDSGASIALLTPQVTEEAIFTLATPSLDTSGIIPVPNLKLSRPR